MPFFKKWSCCRQNVENQVEATSTSNHQPKFDKNDEQFKSDLQAVQWMRDRSKQASKEDEEEEEKEEEGSDKENDSSLAPVSLMKRHSSFSPSTRSPIDTDAFMDAQKPLSTQDEEEMNELTPVSRVSITPPSTNSNNDDENDSTDSNVEETTKLRYGKAVKLLHRSMLEKQKSLTSGEREFLHDLLDEECSVRMDAVEKRVEALESAAQTLEENELFEVDAPPSPSQTLQHYSPPRRPMCRGIKLSVVRPAESCGEAFELSIRSSSYMNDDDFDDRDFDDTPLLVIGMFTRQLCVELVTDVHHILILSLLPLQKTSRHHKNCRNRHLLVIRLLFQCNTTTVTPKVWKKTSTRCPLFLSIYWDNHLKLAPMY